MPNGDSSVSRIMPNGAPSLGETSLSKNFSCVALSSSVLISVTRCIALDVFTLDDVVRRIEGESAPVRAAAGEGIEDRALLAGRCVEPVMARRRDQLPAGAAVQKVSPKASSGAICVGASGGGATGKGCVGDSSSPARGACGTPCARRRE